MSKLLFCTMQADGDQQREREKKKKKTLKQLYIKASNSPYDMCTVLKVL